MAHNANRPPEQGRPVLITEDDDDRPQPYTRTVPNHRLPAITAKARQAMRSFTTDNPIGCRHLGGKPCGMLCAQHPAAGLMCQGCMAQHLIRHTRDEEFRCDVCSRIGDEISGVMQRCTGSLHMRDSTGRRRFFAGTVIVLGLGLCPSCNPVAVTS